jgi:hypothetical protein
VAGASRARVTRTVTGPGPPTVARTTGQHLTPELSRAAKRRRLKQVV